MHALACSRKNRCVSTGEVAARSESTSIRVLIVDDNAGFLGAASQVLEQEGLVVVGVASSGGEAVQALRELRPDVVLVDIDLGEESGFMVAQQLADADGIPIVLISAYPEADFVDLVAASPAVGFVSKRNLSASAVSEFVHDRRAGGHRDGS
jgi:CheY-like chemotaxis protein